MFKSRRVTLVLVSLILISLLTWGGVVLAADLWSEDYDETYGTTLDLNPPDLDVVAWTSTSLTLVWTKSPEATHTMVRYSTTGYPATYGSGTEGYWGVGTTVTLTSLTPGQVYYISAWGYESSLDWSWDSTDVLDYTLPGDPSGLACSVISEERIDLSWTMGVGGDLTYVRYAPYSYPNTYSTGLEAYTGGGTACSVDNLTSGTDYYFRAWSRDTDSGYYSAGYTQSACSSGGPPEVTTQEATNIALTTADVNGYIDYSGLTACWVRFDYADTSDNVSMYTDWVWGFVTGDDASATLTGLSLLTEYRFRIQSYNSVTGVGSPVSGEWLTFTTCDAVGNPSGLVASAISSTEILLTWSKGSCSTHSMIRYSTGGYTDNYTSGSQAYFGTESSYVLSGLLPGTTYYFRVWAFAPDDYWSSGYSEALATTPAGTGGGSIPFIVPDGPGNWFVEPNCDRVEDLPGYLVLVKNPADGIGMDDCYFALILCAIVTMLMGLMVGAFVKSPTWLLLTMGAFWLLFSVMGPVPPYLAVAFILLGLPVVYIIPRGIGR